MCGVVVYAGVVMYVVPLKWRVVLVVVVQCVVMGYRCARLMV